MENNQHGTHVIKTRKIDAMPNREAFKSFTDETQLDTVKSDAAHYPNGHTPELVRLYSEAGEAEVAEILHNSSGVVTRGAGSSLTGGVTPFGEIVLDMSYRDRILARGENWITVQSGITLRALQEELAGNNKYYPPVPTFDGATVGGMISTNAAGAATFKYGQTRPWVDTLKVVLATGEVLDMERGQYLAHPDGYFELEGEAGKRRINVPNYTMPDVPKISAGYYAKPSMDLIDLFIGSEGTLGVITEATLRVIPKPLITWALVSCESEEQALELTKRLRNQSLETRRTQDPHGIDASAIEYIDRNSLQLLREDNKFSKDIPPPHDANALLLIQMEMSPELTSRAYLDIPQYLEPTAPDVPMVRFARELERLGLFYRIDLALPGDPRIEQFEKMREAVPIGVNNRISKSKERDPRISKMAADMIVPFENLPEMLRLFQEGFEANGLEYAIWGHISDGNMHPNVIPRSYEEIQIAQRVILECGQAVIAMGGSPLAEHGVGRNPIKQELLEKLYGIEGIEQMRAVKKILDPEWKLAPGNLFRKP